MRHRVAGRKLSRTKNERRRLLVGLTREIIVHGSIKTTLAKARAVQPMIEKLITRAKVGSGGALISIKKTLSDWRSTKLLLDDVKMRFSRRSSGFTRIVKLGTRAGDNAQAVLLSFVDARVQEPKELPKPAKTTKTPKKRIES